jgi:hypothetical protein
MARDEKQMEMLIEKLKRKKKKDKEIKKEKEFECLV